jgi:hypothetical protein
MRLSAREMTQVIVDIHAAATEMLPARIDGAAPLLAAERQQGLLEKAKIVTGWLVRYVSGYNSDGDLPHPLDRNVGEFHSITFKPQSKPTASTTFN